MARVTVEDCIEKVNNRFELVLMASKRAKDIEKGALPSVPKDNDKSTIIALREIAEETISLDGLRELARRSVNEEVEPFIDSNNQDPENEGILDSDIEDSEDEEEDLDDEDIEALQDLDDVLGDETEEKEVE